MLAIASQDGFLRVFQYDTMELLGIARSYFGGFLCVCWSPDGKYIVVGGEDDLVTVWSLNERRVVARGQGHRSWVSVVAFDPFTTSYSNWDGGPDFSDDENAMNDGGNHSTGHHNGHRRSQQDFVNNNNNNGLDEFSTTSKLQNGIKSNRGKRGGSMLLGSPPAEQVKTATSYRLGSVSQDTQLCLWDLTEDVLRQPIRPRLASGDVPQRDGKNHSYNNTTSSTRISIRPLEPLNNNQNSLSSVSSSSMSSTSNNNNNNINTSINKPETTLDSGSKAAEKSMQGGAMANSNKSKSIATMSLIGNCVGNNLHKLTTSSSISSTSSITSNHVGQAAAISVPAAANEERTVLENGLTTETNNGKSSKSSSESSQSSSAGASAFSTLTQRLSHFSFGNERRATADGHNQTTNNNNNGSKKGFTFTKSLGNNSSSELDINLYVKCGLKVPYFN